MTFHLGVIDEAGFAGEALRVILPVTADEKSKVICTTSVNSKEEKSCLLYNLSQIEDYPIYTVSLTCDKHLTKIATTEQATVCPCFILSAPPARSGNVTLKQTMNLLFENSFNEELLGGGTRPGKKKNKFSTVFSSGEAFEFDTRLDTTRMKSQDTCLVAYIDTAFSDSESASKVGISILSTFTNKMVVLGVDECSHESCSTEAVENIARAFSELACNIIQNHPHCTFYTLYIVIERNYAGVFSFPLAQSIVLLLKQRQPSLDVRFLYTKYYAGQQEQASFKVGYFLGYEKNTIFQTIASLFNDGLIVCATVLFTNTLNNPVETIVQQLQRFTDKKTKGNNDVALSFIMAAHFLLNIHNTLYSDGEKYKYRQIA